MIYRLRNRRHSLRTTHLADRFVRRVLVPLVLIFGLFGLVRYAMEGHELSPRTVSQRER